MRYLQENTLGKPLQSVMKPYQRIINNTFVIETQDESLLWQLSQDEKERIKTPIDWFLFKSGETVLIDNHGCKFACVCKNQNYIRLVEMKSDLIIFSKSDDERRLCFVFPTAEDFIDSMNNDDDCMGDQEILCVEWKDKIVYSSLYKKDRTYNETLRTMELYEWFKTE